MTYDVFQAAVRARFPALAFELRLDGNDFHATSPRLAVTANGGTVHIPPTWWVSVPFAAPGIGATLAEAIDAHKLTLRLIAANAAEMGLL